MKQGEPMLDAGARRSWRFRAAPKDTTRAAWLAIAIAGVVAVCCWATLAGVRRALVELGITGTLPVAVLVVLGICALYPLVPALRSLLLARKALRAVAADDLVNARVAAMESSAARWVAISVAAALAVLLLLIQFLIANDLAVSRTFFLLPLMLETLPLVLKAFWTNIYIFTVSEVLVLVVGLVVAVARLAPGKAGRPIRVLSIAYTDTFRGLPAVITIYLVGFGISLTGLPILKDLSPENFAIIALTLTSSAYVAEVYRTGIESIHWSQTAAARSLGLSHLQTLRFVIIPQAVRRMIPPLLSYFISLQKDTALVNIIGSMDAFNQAKIIASNHFNLSAVTTVAIIFIIITIPQTRFVDKLIERRRLASGT
jgi:polar amino acid transport system permease protein